MLIKALRLGVPAKACTELVVEDLHRKYSGTPSGRMVVATLGDDGTLLYHHGVSPKESQLALTFPSGYELPLASASTETLIKAFVHLEQKYKKKEITWHSRH